MSFFTEALPYAEQAHAGTRVLTSVILAQWADEQGYRWPPTGDNPGNVASFDNQPIHVFPSLTAGVEAYIQTMNLGYYTAVRNASGWMAQCYALGASPWASGHYHSSGGAPGEDLVKIIEANNLTQYDGASPTPTPSPTPTTTTTESSMLSLPPTGGLLVAGADGGVFAYDGAGYYGSLPGLKVVPAKPISGIAATPTGKGYWLCGEDGGVFAFGDAGYHGNLVAQVASNWIPCIGIEPWNGGYIMVTHLSGGTPTLVAFSPTAALAQEETDAVTIATGVDPHDGLPHTVTFHSTTGVSV